jgi:hypothetical protein
MSLFASRWSPTTRVGAIPEDGILKAWIRKVRIAKALPVDKIVPMRNAVRTMAIHRPSRNDSVLLMIAIGRMNDESMAMDCNAAATEGLRPTICFGRLRKMDRLESSVAVPDTMKIVLQVSCVFRSKMPAIFQPAIQQEVPKTSKITSKMIIRIN